MRVTNPPSVGAWSGFGMLYSFANPWSLPSNTNAWTNHVFSFAFREASSRPCILEMQIKSDTQNRIEFTKTYSPGAGGWDTIRAALSQFVPVAGSAFNPAHVESVAVNVRMLAKGVAYDGYFDNIYFDAPDQIVPSGTIFSSLELTSLLPPSCLHSQSSRWN